MSHAKAIEGACAAIEASDPAPSLAALAREAGISPEHFQRLFKAQVGLSPKQYAMAVRKRRLREALAEAQSVTRAIYDAGYGASSRAYDDGHALGMVPKAYRRSGAGERIAYVTARSSLGPLLIATTARGVCSIEFGEEGPLVAALRGRFSGADIQPGGPEIEAHARQIVQMIDTPGPRPALPLDIRGTVFQEKVWRALTAIPVGQTRSYAEVAQAIGQPSAARAVARACAANPLAVAVPCHRVVRADGAISGYKWGAERKAELLKGEAERA